MQLRSLSDENPQTAFTPVGKLFTDMQVIANFFFTDIYLAALCVHTFLWWVHSEHAVCRTHGTAYTQQTEKIQNLCA